jgi:hypothetical protein
VLNETRPLLLVICSDEERLATLRAALRGAGFLSASGRSVEAAISLLSQVRVDGCVVAEPLDPFDARRLYDRLERYSTGCPKLCLLDAHPVPPDGWHGCEGNLLIARLYECFDL